MLKKSIGIGLLCLTGQAYANISVTTTSDVVADDKECSLREAVHYVNVYLTVPTSETDTDKTAREAIAKKGYMGCGGESATNTIYLEASKEYILTKEINISSTMTISSGTDISNFDDEDRGTKNAIIKASGTHRLFNIDDNKSEINQIAVSLKNLNLEGCGLTNVCADRGGVIFNRESLSLDFVKISNAYANEGGAIYNEGLVTASNQASAGTVTVSSSIFENNKAKTGAAIFMGQPLFAIAKSVFKGNEVTNANGVLIYSESAFDSGTTNTTDFTRVSTLANTTFLKNKGYLINVRDGVSVNNITAVDNTYGLYFHAPAGKAHLSNSILVGNGVDCTYASNDTSLSLNNLVGAGCKAGEANNPNTYIGSRKIFAGDVSESNECARPPADGLLCPFKVPENRFLGFFKPRLLSSYKTLSESVIVNRGRIYSDGSQSGLASCESSDVRGLSRSGTVQCDLGAVELMITSDSVSRVGQDIRYGQLAKVSILDSLGDGELLPANECAGVLGSAKAPDGKDWQVGCLQVEQNAVTPNSKGSMVLNENGEVVYTPASNYHGLDDFNLRVITTTSRFSESEKDREVVIPMRIVQSPENNFPSKTINTSGGSFGVFGILGLIAMGWYRRKLDK